MAMEPMKGKWASSRVDLGYTELFCIPEVTSVFHSSCDSVLGDSLEFLQKIEAPYMFDWVHGIAQHARQGKPASPLGEGQVSLFFLSCGRNLGYILELRRGWPFKTHVCTAMSGLLSSYNGHLRNQN